MHPLPCLKTQRPSSSLFYLSQSPLHWKSKELILIMPKLKLPQKSLPTLLKLRTETAILQDKLIPKEFAHALTERTTYLKETNVYVPNTLLSGTANTALDVLPEWTSIWTSESATSALKDSFEDTRS